MADFDSQALDFLRREIDERKRKFLYRSIPKVEQIKTPYLTIHGEEHLNFSSNDYLGLGSSPIDFQQLQGLNPSSTSSRLIGGDSPYLNEAEEVLCSLYNGCQAIIFPSTWQANISVISSLVNRNDLICIDRYAHNSLIRGAQLSGAQILRFRHQDLEHLTSLLHTHRSKYRRCLIISESIFSMHGTKLDIPTFVKIAKSNQAISLIDEAHAFGVFGVQGRGLVKGEDQPDIRVGALGKSAGSSGGFVIGSIDLKHYLQNFGDGLIFSTAISPIHAAIITQQLRKLKQADELRAQLKRNVEYLHAKWKENGIEVEKSSFHIQSIFIKNEERVLEIKDHLMNEFKVYLSAIRPPTVPPGQSCLRISLTATHKIEHLDQLVRALKSVGVHDC